jgi:hypothetical protein
MPSDISRASKPDGISWLTVDFWRGVGGEGENSMDGTVC